jgi:leucyl aminopeptidase (aminopeptidase T)
MTQLDKAARTILRECLGVKSHESVLIVTEDSLWEIEKALWSCAKRLTKFPLLTRFSSKHLNISALPSPVISSFKTSDIVLFITQKCVNVKLFDDARRQGTRFLVLQNISNGLLDRLLETNYKILSYHSRRLADIFSIGKTLYLTSPSGTDAQFSIARIKGIADTGLVHKAGDFTLLPAGEACLELRNQNVEGRIVLDRIAGYGKRFSKPIVLNIKNNYINQIKGEKGAEQLRKEIRKFGRDGRRIQEFGVGTNEKAMIGYSAQEDEKVLGTVHVGFGQNRTTKVRNKIIQPIKGLVLKPTLKIDGKLIIEHGNLLV